MENQERPCDKERVNTFRITPSQIKVTYLDRKGEQITDPAYPHRNYHWEVEFIGVDIDPDFVVCVRFPELNYKLNGSAWVEVDVYADPEARKQMKAMVEKMKNIGAGNGAPQA